MTYRVEYISTFHKDVLQIVASLEQYPMKASRIFYRLDKILTNLINLPEMYPIYEDFPFFRKITVEDYLVFYAVNKQDRVIEIHRLIYARTDIARQLK